MKSSSTNTPVVTVTAMAYVQPALSVMPPQLGLPPGPLADKLTPSVTIINNTSNKLVLSEAAINTTNVEVQIRETIPGKNFALSLSFPAGFEIAQGQTVLLSVKTDNPQNPLLKIPVYQLPRQAAGVGSRPNVTGTTPRSPAGTPVTTYVPVPRPSASRPSTPKKLDLPPLPPDPVPR
jgi:hypothetical protein